MAGINHVTGEWLWIPGTRGLKQGYPMKDGKIDNKNNNLLHVFFPLDGRLEVYPIQTMVRRPNLTLS